MDRQLQSPATISVVVPCHNYGRFVDAALDSIVKQTRPPDEIVLIDDGSDDDSWERIESFARARRDTVLIRRFPARGAVTTFNDGVRKSRGILVVILSADDKLSPEYLNRMEEAIVSHGWDFAYSDIRCFGTDEDSDVAVPELGIERLREQTYVTGSVMFRVPEYSTERLRQQNYIHGSAMFRRRLFDDIGGFSTDFEHVGLEDWEFWVRAARAGAVGGRVSGCHLKWRRHPERSRNQLSGLQLLRAYRLLRRRHGDGVRRPRPLHYGLHRIRRLLSGPG